MVYYLCLHPQKINDLDRGSEKDDIRYPEDPRIISPDDLRLD